MRRDTWCRRRRKSCAEVETATAQQQQALYDYLRTIQRSFREVEDSLIATRKIREQQAAQDRQVQALQRTLRLASLRYENGYSSFLEVLDAQRSLFSAELQQVQLQRARLGAIVDLYKALGGGWVPLCQFLFASSSGPIIELSIVAEDPFLIKGQPPLGRKIGSQPQA